MRVALYARYSSDRQHDRSIADQLRLCREHLPRAFPGERVEEVGVYCDHAISGTHLRSRPEAMRLLADARDGRFDAVLVEAIDRLSRNQAHIAEIHERLAFAGIALVSVTEGAIGELHIGLKGTMNALYSKDLAHKVRRGQAARAAEGLAPGGRAYGYRIVRGFDARGELLRGRRAIDEAEAEIVRRIFRAFVAGESARAIAARLNREGVKSPSGRQWSAGTINGSRARRTGILNNEIYVGRLIYNRQRFTKDPDTGRRVPTVLPRSEWRITAVPALRIVDDATWDAAQALKARRGDAYPLHRRTRPRHLFSGLVACGLCGAPYTVQNGSRLACSAARERGTCGNKRPIAADAVARRVLDTIRAQLLEPARVARFLAIYRAERRAAAAEIARGRSEAEHRLREVERALARVVDAICQAGHTPAIVDRLRDLEREKAELEARVAAARAAAAVVELHPAAIDHYRALVERLAEALKGRAPADLAGDQAEAAAAVRRLVTRIEVHPLPQRGKAELTLVGEIAQLINLATRAPGQPLQAVVMVAGEGFEPPTKGL